MKKRPKKKPHQSLIRAKNIVRGALATDESDIAHAVVTAAKPLSADTSENLFKWLKTYPAKRRRLAPPSMAKEYSSLWPSRRSIVILDSFDHSLRWITSILLENTDKLVKYIYLLDKYETSLMSNQLLDALSSLDEIEKELGVSIWMIEAKLALLQRTHGIEEQKAYCDIIRDAAPVSLPAFVAHFTSERNEPSVSFARYSKKIERVISTQSVTPAIRKYITRRLLGLKGDAISVEDISHVMCVAGGLSVLDAYEGFIWACQTSIQKGIAQNFSRTIVQCLNRLDTGDWRIRNIQSYLKKDFSALPVLHSHDAHLLLQGSYSAAFEESIKASTLNVCSVDALATAAYASACGALELPSETNGDIKGEIVSLLNKVISKEEGVGRAADELIKFVLNHRSLRNVAAIYGYLLMEWGEELQVGECEGTSLYLSSPELNPLHWHVLGRHVGAAFVDAVSAKVDSAVLCTMCNANPDEEELRPLNVAGEFDLLYRARRALMRRDLTLAKAHLQELGESEQKLWRRAAAKLEVHCLIALNETREAILRAAHFCCENEELRHIVPLRPILQGTRWRQVRHLRDRIEIPIIFDLYWRTIEESEHETNRRIAYDEFLMAHNCRRPSELKPSIHKFEPDALRYFLRYVCVQEVMDVSFDVYESSREIEEERIAVCQWLSEIDPDKRVEYSEEIVSLTKLINIQDGLRDVDSSRIYVDVEAIERWAEKEMSESFDRYRLLVEAGVGFGSPSEMEAALKDFVGVINGQWKIIFTIQTGKRMHCY